MTALSTSLVDPDGPLVRAMADGDSKALEALMDRHLSALKSLAWHMLGDDMAAEDVAQEVFLKSWISARTWTPGKAKFITWMRRVATNACLDRLRKRKEVLTDTVPEGVDDRLSVDRQIIQTQSAGVVKSAIDKLPARQRAAIALCHYQNVSQREAADILEISESAYESLLSRARRKLKNDLDGQGSQLISDLGSAR